jgi:hypothetical protein
MTNRPAAGKITTADQSVWTLAATMARWAFFVTLGTLMRIWMIFSKLLSWRQDKPVAKLNIGTVHFFYRDPLLRVNVMNTSSSPLAVTSIFIWTKQQNGRKGGRAGNSASRSGGEVNSIMGPSFPFTIDGLHSQSWTLDSEWPKLSMAESRGAEVREVKIEVRLTPNKSVARTIKFCDYFNLDEIAHLTDCS